MLYLQVVSALASEELDGPLQRLRTAPSRLHDLVINLSMLIWSHYDFTHMKV